MTARRGDELPVLLTPRLRLFIAGPQDAERCVSFNRENAEFLAPWEPRISPRAFEPQAQGELRSRAVAAALAGTSYSFAIAGGQEETGAPFLGWCTLDNVVRGVFQAAHLGYKLDRRAQGHGYMTEALTALIDYAFNVLLLHRVMANYMPHNQRSAAVLRRLGFRVEGAAKQYLYIAGEWRDHTLTAKINPSPLPPPGQ